MNQPSYAPVTSTAVKSRLSSTALASCLWLTVLALALALTAAGCGDDVQSRQDVEQDIVNDTPADNGDVDNDSGDTGDMEEDMTQMGLAPGSYTNCSGNGDCADGLCINSVCVSDPTATSYIAVEEDGVIEFEDIAPEVSCYAPDAALDPNEGVEPAPADQRVTVYGDIERFGPGPSTFDVCVTFYDQERLMRFLDESSCNELPVGQERVDCFRRDPCRCDDLAGGAQIDCYKEVGLCDALEGADKAECEGNIPAGGPLIYGYGKSICEDGEGNEIGCTDAGVRIWYRIPNIPVNRNLVVKTSGLELRWVDTYEYGVLLPWKDADTDMADPVTGDTNTFSYQANVISKGAWETIPTTAGLPFPMDTLERGAIAGRILDCGLENRSMADPQFPQLDDPQPMVHATFGLATRADSPPDRLAYFNGNPDDSLPDPGRVDTNTLAVYAGLNVPYGKNRMVVRVDYDSQPDGGDCVEKPEGGFACLGGTFDVFTTPYSVSLATPEASYFEVE